MHSKYTILTRITFWTSPNPSLQTTLVTRLCQNIIVRTSKMSLIMFWGNGKMETTKVVKLLLFRRKYMNNSDMTFYDAIRKRGSYRQEFLAEAVPEEVLLRIMEAGCRAPSGYNFQTTSFLVVTNPDLLTNLADIAPSPATNTAPAMIIPLSSKKESPKTGLSFEIEDYAAAVENILLAITAEGYAAVWMDGAVNLEDRRERINKLLQVPDDRFVRAIIPLGRPEKEVTQREKMPLEERVKWLR